MQAIPTIQTVFELQKALAIARNIPESTASIPLLTAEFQANMSAAAV